MPVPPDADSPQSAPTSEDFRLLVEGVSDYAIILLDQQARVATWNRGAERIHGYEAEAIIGQHVAVFYGEEARAREEPTREIAAALRDGRVEDEGYRFRRDGTRFWANVVITALYDETKALRGFATITRDLTERRAGELRLRHAEERFHRLVDSVTDYAMFMLDPAGTVETWNAGARRAKGYEASEIVGRHFSLFYPPEDRAAGRPAQILDLVRREGRFEEEGYRVRKDGSRFWANVIITALRDDEGELTGFAKVTRDLTQRRAAEQTQQTLLVEQAARTAAESMAQRAEHANRVKDEFLATVSHELRTPLNAIVGWSKILRQEKLEGVPAHAAEVIERNARAQVKIVEDILDVSRIITGKLRIDPQPMDLVHAAREAVEVVRPSTVARQQTLSFASSASSLPIVADAERLQQVVWNLLSNAVKFTPVGGTVSLCLDSADDQAVITVRDSGSGIDPAFLPLVFDRFQQADASTTRRVGGLGLGLALVRHILELHGGTVEVESAGLGTGTTFRCRLPLRATVVPPAPESRPLGDGTPAPPAAVSQILQGARILVVDDEPDARELVSAILTRAGARARVAGSVSEAFEALDEERPDVIVSDIGMPDEDGYALAQRLRARRRSAGGSLPAIALTAYTRAEDRTKALAAGFTSHVGKPVDPDELVAAVAGLLAIVPRTS